MYPKLIFHVSKMLVAWLHRHISQSNILMVSCSLIPLLLSPREPTKWYYFLSSIHLSVAWCFLWSSSCLQQEARLQHGFRSGSYFAVLRLWPAAEGPSFCLQSNPKCPTAELYPFFITIYGHTGGEPIVALCSLSPMIAHTAWRPCISLLTIAHPFP